MNASFAHQQLRTEVQTALSAAGIVPDPTATYTSDAIVAAIETGLGAEPLVHCQNGMLTEVRDLPSEALPAYFMTFCVTFRDRRRITASPSDHVMLA